MQSWRRTFYCCLIAQFFSICAFSFVLPFMPFFIRDLGITNEKDIGWWAGISIAVTGIAMTVISPIWGILADRYGRKMMVVRAMIGGAAVCALMSLARNITDLMILRVLQGLFTGTAAATTALVASVAPEEESGYAMGMIQASVYAGACAGPLLSAVASVFMGLRATFLVAGGVLFLAGCLVGYGVNENFERPSAHPNRRPTPFSVLFASIGFLFACAMIFLINFASSAPGGIFPLYIEHLMHSPLHVLGFAWDAKFMTGVIISISAFSMALAAGSLGRLGDKWGHRKLLAVSAIVAGLVTIPQAFARNVTDLTVLRFLLGATAGGLLPAANTIVKKIVPADSLGRAFGVITSMSAVGFSLGPIAGGYIAAQKGLASVFVVSGALLVLMGVLVAVYSWRRPFDPAIQPEVPELAPMDEPQVD